LFKINKSQFQNSVNKEESGTKEIARLNRHCQNPVKNTGECDAG